MNQNKNDDKKDNHILTTQFHSIVPNSNISTTEKGNPTTNPEQSENTQSFFDDGMAEKYIYGESNKYLKNKRHSFEHYDIGTAEQNNKKIKSEGDVKSKKEPKFFLKIHDNYEEIYNRWKKIKSIEINKQGKVINKLSTNELILKNCQQIAINKLKNLKVFDLNEILNILSYDNTNQSVLYYCFQMLKRHGNLNNWLEEYKYCFCDEYEIVDFFGGDKTNEINLSEEFNFKFVFKNIEEGIKTLKDTLNNLLLFVDKYYDYYLDNKLPLDNKYCIYNYDDRNNLIKNGKNHELFQFGYEWLKFFPKIKELDNFQGNQPFSFNNNKILYISFCIKEIYNPLLTLKEEAGEITINKKYFLLVYTLKPLLKSLINDLEFNNIDEEFHHKIRFFYLTFETRKLYYKDIITNFIGHIFQEKDRITESDVNEFIKIKKRTDKIAGYRRQYFFSKNVLEIKEPEGSIKFEIKDYDKSLFNELYKEEIFLKTIWEKNSLGSFQMYNFLSKEDISFLKDIIKPIFKSKFWEEICSYYGDNDFTEKDIFKNEDFINQFLNRIVFLPFDINHLEFFAYTTADDLYVYISGYPYMGGSHIHNNYTSNRILQLGVSIIIILHEAIHYYKRLLFFLTCNMVSRLTIIENERKEGGQLFEEILFGWKVDEADKTVRIKNITKNINLTQALNLLNTKTYEKGIYYAKSILSSNDLLPEQDELFKNYLSILDLSEPEKFKEFFDKNKTKTINASKEKLREEYVINYFSSDHRRFRK